MKREDRYGEHTYTFMKKRKERDKERPCIKMQEEGLLWHAAEHRQD